MNTNEEQMLQRTTVRRFRVLAVPGLVACYWLSMVNGSAICSVDVGKAISA